MTWRLRAGPGSFRGVPFRVEATRFGGGRKSVVHEYPLRDDQFVEDLGRRGRSVGVDAYVIGDRYIELRDDLIRALEAQGPGRLSLPYISLESSEFLLDRFSVEESREEGGFARFLMEFLETPAEPVFPAAAPDNLSAIDASLAKTFDTLGANFVIDYDIEGDGLLGGVPPFTFESLSSVVSAAGNALRTAFAPVTGAIGAITGTVDKATAFAADIKRQVDGLILDADMLVRSPFVAVDRFRDIFEAVFDSPALPSRNIDALLEVYEFQSDTPAPAPVTTNRAREAANYRVLQSLIQRMAVASTARFAVRAEFESFEQAVTTRDRIAELLDEQAETASDDIYQVLVDLRATLVRAVPGETSNLPRLLSFTPPTTLPSLVIAHRIYGSVDKELDLVARNRVRHPGFVLGGRALEVLSDA